MNKANIRLNGIKAKIDRAEQHILALKEMDDNYRIVECSLSIEKDIGTDCNSLVFNLPEPKIEVSIIVGDCLNNLRSSLDYLIWQIVDSNNIAEVSNRNMFPICTSETAFNNEVTRKRLRGVPEKAIEIIRGLQPYDGRENNYYLQMLSELCNRDKHRDLIYSVVIASDVELSFSSRGKSFHNLIIGNDEIRGGRIFGGIGFDSSIFSGKDVAISGSANAFLSFRDPASEVDVLPIVNTLEEMSDFVKHEVISLLLDNISES